MQHFCRIQRQLTTLPFQTTQHLRRAASGPIQLLLPRSSKSLHLLCLPSPPTFLLSSYSNTSPSADALHNYPKAISAGPRSLTIPQQSFVQRQKAGALEFAHLTTLAILSTSILGIGHTLDRVLRPLTQILPGAHSSEMGSTSEHANWATRQTFATSRPGDRSLGSSVTGPQVPPRTFQNTPARHEGEGTMWTYPNPHTTFTNSTVPWGHGVSYATSRGRGEGLPTHRNSINSFTSPTNPWGHGAEIPHPMNPGSVYRPLNPGTGAYQPHDRIVPQVGIPRYEQNHMYQPPAFGSPPSEQPPQSEGSTWDDIYELPPLGVEPAKYLKDMQKKSFYASHTVTYTQGWVGQSYQARQAAEAPTTVPRISEQNSPRDQLGFGASYSGFRPPTQLSPPVHPGAQQNGNLSGPRQTWASSGPELHSNNTQLDAQPSSLQQRLLAEAINPAEDSAHYSTTLTSTQHIAEGIPDTSTLEDGYSTETNESQRASAKRRALYSIDLCSFSNFVRPRKYPPDELRWILDHGERHTNKHCGARTAFWDDAAIIFNKEFRRERKPQALYQQWLMMTRNRRGPLVAKESRPPSTLTLAATPSSMEEPLERIPLVPYSAQQAWWLLDNLPWSTNEQLDWVKVRAGFASTFPPGMATEDLKKIWDEVRPTQDNIAEAVMGTTGSFNSK